MSITLASVIFQKIKNKRFTVSVKNIRDTNSKDDLVPVRFENKASFKKNYCYWSNLQTFVMWNTIIKIIENV